MIEQIEWIACAERMPDDRRTVLMGIDCLGERVRAGWYNNLSACWHWPSGAAVAGIVTHWAELPAGPRG